MAQLTKLQQEICDRAHEELKVESWYSGVCGDKFKDDELCDEAILEMGIAKAVELVIMDTEYWSGDWS